MVWEGAFLFAENESNSHEIRSTVVLQYTLSSAQDRASPIKVPSDVSIFISLELEFNKYKAHAWWSVLVSAD